MSKPPRRSPSAKNNGKATSSPAAASQTQVPRPALDDQDAWKAYWATQGQAWRTEPEIDMERQRELSERRVIDPDAKEGIYPFSGIKLSRADIEWLLATHENGRGPIDWNDEKQRKREGLDVRGADLNGVNLGKLPLARLCGGLSSDVFTTEEHQLAAVQMRKTVLTEAQLEGARLREAQLKGAWLVGARLKNASLMGAQLERAHLMWAQLEHVALREAVLADKEGIGPQLVDVQWNDINLTIVDWSQIKILGDEYEARQRKSSNGKPKNKTRQIGEYREAVRANRQLVALLQSQGLNEDAVRFAYRVQVLQKHVWWLLITQRGIKINQRSQALWAWIFSWFLFLLAGYGYRPSRSFLAYFLVISGFATAYYLLGHTVGPALSPLGAFVFSMTSFHGRGFFPGSDISLDDPLTVLAALEALVGLIIEVTFIATLTQRFFNR